ncbi:hypothetical protein Hanom_Chr03g00208481 [Helianthus anomalus]
MKSSTYGRREHMLQNAYLCLHIYRVIVVNICACAMIIMLQILVSSSKSGLSEEYNPMGIVSDDDEVALAPEVFTLDTESDPDMISDDNDDFQPFVLPDFGDDIPVVVDVLIDDTFALPIPDQDHLIIGHPDGEHLGDGEVDDVIVLDVPPPVAAGLRLYATDDDDAMSAAPSSPIRAPTPPHVPDPVPDTFAIPFIAPLFPEPVSAPFDLPRISPLVPQPPPTADVPLLFSPFRGGYSGQPPSFDPFASADFPPIPQFTPFTSDPLNEPFRWFPTYTMPISDPYHPSHHVGYTRDDLLLFLQLQFEILSRRVLELELTPSYPPPIPPFPFVPPSAASTSTAGFDARFLMVEQQISYLVCRFPELHDELAHIRSLIFFPPPPPPSASYIFHFMQVLHFDENATIKPKICEDMKLTF